MGNGEWGTGNGEQTVYFINLRTAIKVKSKKLKLLFPIVWGYKL